MGFAAGILLAALTFAPAVALPMRDDISFFEVHSAGRALLALGLVTAAVSVARHLRGLWLTGGLALFIIAAMYARISRAPTGWFVDPVVQRLARPGWGFTPMLVAALAILLAAWMGRQGAREPAAPSDHLA